MSTVYAALDGNLLTKILHYYISAIFHQCLSEGKDIYCTVYGQSKNIKNQNHSKSYAISKPLIAVAIVRCHGVTLM